MGLGVSILLIAVGLILALAVHTHLSGVDIHTVGWIVAIVGFVGLVLSMIFWSSWAGPGYWTRRRGAYGEGPPPGPPYEEWLRGAAQGRPASGVRDWELKRIRRRGEPDGP